MPLRETSSAHTLGHMRLKFIIDLPTDHARQATNRLRDVLGNDRRLLAEVRMIRTSMLS
ncbi:hypothetical protein D3C85_1710900 [compost metagenome]